MKGRKRHILVDTLGLLLVVVVLQAGLSDKVGGNRLLEWARSFLPRLFKVWADQSYRGLAKEWLHRTLLWFVEIVKRKEGVKGFYVLAKRWIVERTFAWFGKYRRLSKDYEYLPSSSEAFVYIASIHLMLRRLEPD